MPFQEPTHGSIDVPTNAAAAALAAQGRNPPRPSRERHAVRLIPALAVALGLTFIATAPGCGLNSVRAAVTLSLSGPRGTPPDASVYIDEQYIGPLYYVAAHGVRLPVGEHRITITREGYFPWDRLVEAGRQPINVEVELVPIPE